ncbi:polyprotein [Hibiscus syriacus]|uniref:Polyprotein n=1 Tax=Hibiscus syriacus TaxID=106335 RepID=A0A6A3ALJ3_HIBSY|nr:polyprotein [Hibiscus syriacus]
MAFLPLAPLIRTLTFPIPRQLIVTENRLKLINKELEKFLGAEAKEEGCNDSSARNSYLSTGRSSHCSTSTLSGRPNEGPDTNGNDATLCPLQGYLSGSAIELSETTTVAKKEHRTSLGELFQRTKITDESLWSDCDDEQHSEKEGDKSAVQIMKKKMPNAFRCSTAATGGNISTYNHGKPQKNENKEGIVYDVGHMLADDDIIIYPHRSLSKNVWRYKSLSKPPQFTLSCYDSNGNRECWIKTDADYLVLEL